MKPKQASEVEWMVAKRDQLIVTALASATKIRPERSSRVPLAQLIDRMHSHDNRYEGADERPWYVQFDLHWGRPECLTLSLGEQVTAEDNRKEPASFASPFMSVPPDP
ncbi:hypothetical protein [Bradyrhizobium sp. CCBAU 53415]|uniref:hypothetical protein n=1 Tax=Bradyrhizobium sp. CCBAU 53415 TaxID=1325119 RepID=UPI0023067E1D|nr:hypothetical protein [Bradyrhizobium sp. CCBAU 53415]